MSEWHCSINNTRYGPISKDQLLSWIAEGRVSSSDLVWREGMADWQPVGDIAELAGALSSAVPPIPSGPRASNLPAHRGGAVLALGILAIPFACFFVFGIISWVMGKCDLASMAAGRMDPGGWGITQAGKICGMVGVFVGIAWVAWYVVWMVLMTTLMSLAR